VALVRCRLLYLAIAFLLPRRAVAPRKELRWQGRLLLPGLFTGQHYFQIEEMGPGKVKFVHGEDFFGVLVPLVHGSFPAVEEGFKLMNAKLKERAEKGP
jgi:hypothetical protein